LIDLIAQTGHASPNAQGVADFIVEGEQHFWVDVAIDRFYLAGAREADRGRKRMAIFERPRESHFQFSRFIDVIPQPGPLASCVNPDQLEASS
jgi:hypothetical protein